MIRSAKSWDSIIILTAIAGLAVILSIISYQYSSSTSNDIVVKGRVNYVVAMQDT